MAEKSYFNSKRDKELIASGSHFWCSSCLYARARAEQSPDTRYCQGCYEVLKKEAELLPPKTRKPSWMPQDGDKTSADVPLDGTQIMSTINDQKSKVDIIRPETPKVTRSKRGPKFTALPDDLIRQWASEGIGSKAISTRLRAEGYDVSYKTIQRRLQGQGMLL